MSEVDFDSNKYKLRYEFFSETDEDNKVFCLPCQKVMLKSSRATHSKTRKHFDNCERGQVSQPIDVPKKSKKVVQTKSPIGESTIGKPTKQGKVEVTKMKATESTIGEPTKKVQPKKAKVVKKKQVVVVQEPESFESSEEESEESESDFSEDE